MQRKALTTNTLYHVREGKYGSNKAALVLDTRPAQMVSKTIDGRQVWQPQWDDLPAHRRQDATRFVAVKLVHMQDGWTEAEAREAIEARGHLRLVYLRDVKEPLSDYMARQAEYIRLAQENARRTRETIKANTPTLEAVVAMLEARGVALGIGNKAMDDYDRDRLLRGLTVSFRVDLATLAQMLGVDQPKQPVGIGAAILGRMGGVC